jgi:hypothetical protein
VVAVTDSDDFFGRLEAVEAVLTTGETPVRASAEKTEADA